MANIKPEFLSLAICETVIEDKATGNKTVINIFNTIFAKAFPVRHPRLTVFAALTGVHDNVPIRVRLVRDQDEFEVFSANGPLHVADPLMVADIVFQLQLVPFERPGIYSVELFGAEELLARRRFQVVQVA